MNCIVAADLWIYVRRKEIAVRLIWGVSVYRVFLDMLLQSVKLCGIAAAVGFLLQLVGVGIHLDRVLGINLHLSWYNIGMIAALTLGTSFLGIVGSFRNMLKSAREQLARGVE